MNSSHFGNGMDIACDGSRGLPNTGVTAWEESIPSLQVTSTPVNNLARHTVGPYLSNFGSPFPTAPWNMESSRYSASLSSPNPDGVQNHKSPGQPQRHGGVPSPSFDQDAFVDSGFRSVASTPPSSILLAQAEGASSNTSPSALRGLSCSSSGVFSSSDMDVSSIDIEPVSPSTIFLDESVSQNYVSATPITKPQRSKKPKETYIALISQAILSTRERKMAIGDMYEYISLSHPYYRTTETAWKNAVRHNLSINEFFIKNGRTYSGRGYYWSIHPACVDDFVKGNFNRREARRKAMEMNKKRENSRNAVQCSSSSPVIRPIPLVAQQSPSSVAATMKQSEVLYRGRHQYPIMPYPLPYPSYSYGLSMYGYSPYCAALYGQYGQRSPMNSHTYTPTLYQSNCVITDQGLKP